MVMARRRPRSAAVPLAPSANAAARIVPVSRCFITRFALGLVGPRLRLHAAVLFHNLEELVGAPSRTRVVIEACGGSIRRQHWRNRCPNLQIVAGEQLILFALLTIPAHRDR